MNFNIKTNDILTIRFIDKYIRCRFKSLNLGMGIDSIVVLSPMDENSECLLHLSLNFLKDSVTLVERGKERFVRNIDTM